jgi:hypothetical protein
LKSELRTLATYDGEYSIETLESFPDLAQPTVAVPPTTASDPDAFGELRSGAFILLNGMLPALYPEKTLTP